MQIGAKIQNGCFSAGQKDQGSSGNDHSAIAFSKGFMRRQRTDKRSLILLQLIPYTRPKCTAKESVMKGF